jgi:hypothetical protein
MNAPSLLEQASQLVQRRGHPALNERGWARTHHGKQPRYDPLTVVARWYPDSPARTLTGAELLANDILDGTVQVVDSPLFSH